MSNNGKLIEVGQYVTVHAAIPGRARTIGKVVTLFEDMAKNKKCHLDWFWYVFFSLIFDTRYIERSTE